MSTSLTGRTPAATYKDLLQVSNGNSGIDATLRVVADGEATDSPLYLSTTKIKIKPSSDSTAVFEVQDKDGNAMFTVDTSANKITAASGVTWEGNGANLTGITGATGGISNTGSTNIVGDSDVSGAGDITLTIGATDLVKLKNNGSGNGGILEIVETSTHTTPDAGNVGISAENNQLVRVNESGDASPILAADGWSDPLPAYITDGTDDYASIPDNANLNFGTGDFSIEWYSKLSSDNDTGTETILAKGGGSAGSNGYRLRRASTNVDQLELKISDGSVADTKTFSDINCFDDNYHHLAVVIDRKNSKAIPYMDGVVYGEQSLSITDTVSSSSILEMFAVSSSFFCKGDIVFNRFYNRALTASEVTEHWNNGEPEKYVVPFKYRGASNTELVTNGSFTTDTDWVKDSGWSIGSGIATFSGISDATIYLPGVFPNIQKVYKLSYEVVTSTIDGLLRIPTAKGSATALTISNTVGVHELVLDDVGGTSFGFRVAGNTTGIISIDNVSIIAIGNVLDLQAKNAGSMGWLDASGNGLHAVTSGSPIAPYKLRDFKSGIRTTVVEFVNSQKDQTVAKGIIVETASGSPTTISLGTTSAATEFLSAQTFTTGDFIALDKYSASERSLFAKCDAGTVDITIIYDEVA